MSYRSFWCWSFKWLNINIKTTLINRLNINTKTTLIDRALNDSAEKCKISNTVHKQTFLPDLINSQRPILLHINQLWLLSRLSALIQPNGTVRLEFYPIFCCILINFGFCHDCQPWFNPMGLSGWGLQAHTQGELDGSDLGGSPGPHPEGSTGPHLGGGLQAHTWEGGLQAHTWEGVSRPTLGVCVYPSMHWGRHPPDSYCCGRYASYWNAFLFNLTIPWSCVHCSSL